MTYGNWPTPAAQPPAPAPGTITAARVIGWIQVGLTILGTLIVVIFAVFINNAVNRFDSSSNDSFRSLGDLATGILVVFILLLCGLITAIAVPLARLKPGHPGAGTGLVVVESIFILLDVISFAGDDSSSFALISMLISIAMVILLSVPSSRQWLKFGTAPAMSAAPNPYQYPQQPFQQPPFQQAQYQYPQQSGPAPGWSAQQTGPQQTGQWAADPAGRNQSRYYNGTAWTDWVSNNGAVTADPL